MHAAGAIVNKHFELTNGPDKKPP